MSMATAMWTARGISAPAATAPRSISPPTTTPTTTTSSTFAPPRNSTLSASTSTATATPPLPAMRRPFPGALSPPLGGWAARREPATATNCGPTSTCPATPTGRPSAPTPARFVTQLDGNGHTIANLTIGTAMSGNTDDKAGLFGMMDTAGSILRVGVTGGQCLWRRRHQPGTGHPGGRKPGHHPLQLCHRAGDRRRQRPISQDRRYGGASAGGGNHQRFLLHRRRQRPHHRRKRPGHRRPGRATGRHRPRELRHYHRRLRLRRGQRHRRHHQRIPGRPGGV